MKRILSLLALLVITASAYGQSIWATIASSHYTQNFDSLVKTGKGTKMPFAWSFFELGSSQYADGKYVTSSYVPGPNVFSLGDEGGGNDVVYPGYTDNYTPDHNDRAIGAAIHETFCPFARFGMAVTNGEADSVLSGFLLSYKGETWNQQTPLTQIDTLMFYYSLDADSVGDTAANWIPVKNLSYLMVAGYDAVNAYSLNYAGNLPENSMVVNGAVDNIMVIPGQEFFIMWEPKLGGNVQSALAGVDDLTMDFHFNGATGIKNINGRKLTVHTFPNPATTMLNVQLSDINTPVNWRMVNNLGQEVKTGNFEKGTSAHVETIDIAELPNGMYTIYLITEDRDRSAVRFIKQ
jgi:hypothetical protein